MIKLACHSLTWANFYRDKVYDIKEVLKEIKNLDYDGVELVEPLSTIGNPLVFKKYLHTIGLELVSLSCSIDSYLRDRIDFLHDFDTDVVMLCGGWAVKRNRQEGLLIQALRDDLAPITEYARKHHKNIAFHPHKGTVIETRSDLEDFYSEPTSIKLCLDVAHIEACSSSALEVLKEFREKIAYIHLKDYSHKTGKFTELGLGDLNLKPILSYLKDNYTGWATVELDDTATDPAESARISREYLKNLGF